MERMRPDRTASPPAVKDEDGRRLGSRYEAWRNGCISFAEFDASVQGWINHVRYADSWRLREQILRPFVWGPEAYADGR